MSKINIQLSGIGAELVLGNYMPSDTTIFNNWEDFFHYNDLIHHSQLMMEHLNEIEIKKDDVVIFKGKVPSTNIHSQKSSSPVLLQSALYLRTECAEDAVYQCEFEVDNFDKNQLRFETQDYEMLFKVGKSFLSKVFYNDEVLNFEWLSAKPVGNICVLCKFDNGYLVPLYDAVNIISSKA